MRTRFLALGNDSSSCYNLTHPLDLSSSLPYAFSFSISPSTDSAQDTEVLPTLSTKIVRECVHGYQVEAERVSHCLRII